MPYTSPPSKIKHLPKKAQEIWVSAFNSSWKQYKGDEGKAHAVAWSAVKKAGFSTSKMEGETTASSIDPEGKTTNITFAKKKKKRDGKGPRKDSYQAQISNKGKRELAGDSCPKKGGKKKMKKMSKFVKMSNKEKAGLPDSAFAVVYNEGDKKVRKLPYKDSSGKVDVPRLRNTLIRVSQGKVENGYKVMRTLKPIAKSYIEKNKDTRSSEIIANAISKFEANTVDKINSIITTLKKQATNKKPTDEILFEVKHISALIEDLEEIIEYEKSKTEPEEKEEKEEDKDKETKEIKEEKTEEEETKEKKEEETKETKKEEKEAETEKTEEKEEKKEKEAEKSEKTEEETKEKKETEEEKDDSEEEESKFKEAIKLCDDYKSQVDKIQQQMSKFQKENKELFNENKDLKQQLSKFEKESYNKMFNSTLEKVSKFKRLSEADKLNLSKHWLESKMSVTALEELGRMTEDQMLSKLEEPKVRTKPSEMLEPAKQEEDFSKMSNEDKLDALANLQAKQRGFVLE